MGEHSKFAMSSAHRWCVCPGSIHMEELYPETTQSSFAAEGSLAHKVSETILRDSLKTGLSVYESWSKHKAMASDDEMREHVLGYVSTARDLIPLKVEKIAIEKKFILSDQLGIGGTADLAFVYRDKEERVGVILDLKYGAGFPVEVQDNAQLCGYAAAMHKTEEWGPLDRAVVYIYQPRADHSEGSLRSVRLDRGELCTWVEYLYRCGAVAEKELQDGIYTYKPGEHCRWCRGEAVCVANQKHLVGEAGVDFSPTVQPELPAPEILTADQVTKIIRYRSTLESYLKRVEEWATNELLAGHKIEGLKLVKGRASRRWIKDTDSVALHLQSLGLQDPWQKKLMGLTEVEKLLGKGKIGALTETPEPPLKAACVEDKRPAAKPGAQAGEDFEF
jgi:hypothetical protein